MQSVVRCAGLMLGAGIFCVLTGCSQVASIIPAYPGNLSVEVQDNNRFLLYTCGNGASALAPLSAGSDVDGNTKIEAGKLKNYQGPGSLYLVNVGADKFLLYYDGDCAGLARFSSSTPTIDAQVQALQQVDRSRLGKLYQLRVAGDRFLLYADQHTASLCLVTNTPSQVSAPQ